MNLLHLRYNNPFQSILYNWFFKKIEPRMKIDVIKMSTFAFFGFFGTILNLILDFLVLHKLYFSVIWYMISHKLFTIEIMYKYLYK